MHCACLVVAVLRTTHAFIVSQPRILAKTPSPRRRPLRLSTDDEAPTTTLELVATNGGRLDAVLAEAYPERSRSEWGDFVKLGYVRVNDTPCTKKAATVKDRDAIVVELPASTFVDETTCIAEDLPLDLLLEDDHLLVVNKAAGMVTHPAPGHRTGTLANAVAGYCADDAEGMESGRPGIVHRLDRFTSGCIIVARDSEARRSLQKQFADRTVSKLYLAVVCRPPPETDADELVIDEPIGRHPIHRERMAVVEGGRRAVSRVRVLATDGRRCVVQVAIETGRTHQIRVHLAHVGAPVLGDIVYGDASANDRAAKAPLSVARPLLHAWRLGFDHPVSRKRVEVVAPPPPDLARAVRQVSGR